MTSLLNSHLPVIQIAFIILNIIGTIYAMHWNFKASNTGILFKPRFTRGVLALFYFIAYLYLLFSEAQVTNWVLVMQGIGFLSWKFVWGDPPRHAMKVQDDLGDQLERAVLLRMGIEDEKDGNEK